MSGVSIAGVIAGGITLYFTGGNFAAAAFAYTLAAGIESYVLAPDIQGPRLEDRKIQISTYGAQIPIVFGSFRLAGNVIWPRNFEVQEHSTAQSTKGGGGDTISYNYSATFAVLLCEGPIAGVGRIWMNKKLMYDPSSSSATTDPAIRGPAYLPRPDPLGMTFYLGTETQEPDPLMVAVDGSAPAYRGWAYIVFENLELTNSGFGNRLPSVEVEVFTSAVISGPPSPRVVELGDSAAIGAFQAGAAVVDPVTGLIWSSTPQSIGAGFQVRVNSDDLMRRVGTFSVALANVIGGGKGQICYVPLTSTAGEIWVVGDVFGVWYDRIAVFNTVTKTYTTTTTGLYHGTAYIMVMAYNPATLRVMAFRDGGGVSLFNPITRAALTISDFYLGESPGSLGTAWINTCIITPLYFCVHSWGSYSRVTIRLLTDYSHVATVTTSYTFPSTMFYDSDLDRLVLCATGQTFEIINLTTFSVTTHTYSTPAGADTVPPVSAVLITGTYAGGNYIFGADGGSESGSTLFTVNPVTLVCDYAYTYETYSGTQLMAEPLLVPKDTTRQYLFSFDRDSVKRLYFRGTVAGAPVTLSSIVSSLCTRVPFGLDTSDIDVTALTDLVEGYLVGQQMTRRSAIEPLMAAHFFDGVESDHLMKYVKRGGSSAVTIVQDDRAAHLDGEELPAHLNILRASELELPWTIDVTYTDKERDYQPSTQYDRRITRNANDPRRIELAIVMSAEKAKQVALVNLYLPWLRTRFAFSTGLAYGKYEPTDVITLPTDDVTYVARITRRADQGNGIIQWEAELEDSAIYTQTGTVSTTTFVPQTIRDPGITDLVMLDTPILRDADDNAGYYVAMGGSTAGWPGATLFKSTDNGSSYASVLSIVNEAAIGTASGVLGNFTAGNIFDEGNSVTVSLTSGGPLVSATEDQVLNGSNTAVLGAHGRWEVINFKTATLTDTDTYLLSGLLRGRRGTEWATGTHLAGDTFVVASTSTWQRPNPGSAEIGLERLYKAPPFGTQLSAATAESFTNSAVGLEPYAPANLAGTRDGSGNLTITWNRRSRYGYGGLHTIVPLGEAVESYSIDIMSGATVLRTIASATPTAAYTSAMQVTDWGANQSAVTVNVYQISATVARGYALNGTI